MYRQVCILGCSHPQLWEVAEVCCSITQAHGNDVSVIRMYDNSVNSLILDTVEGVEYYPSVSLHEMVVALGLSQCCAMPFIYSLSGRDTVSLVIHISLERRP